MKNLILAVLLATIATTASASTVTIRNVGAYTADVWVFTDDWYSKTKDLVLGTQWVVDTSAGGDWEVSIRVNRTQYGWKSNGDTYDVILELQGSVFNPSIKKVN